MKRYFVPGDETDPKIVRSDNLNMIVIDDHESEQGALLVFLGGVNSFLHSPYRPFFEQSIRAGYRLIALDYQYEPQVTTNCWRSNDDESYARNLAGKAFGMQKVMGLNLAPEECIENRLTKLLLHCVEHLPNTGWNSYLNGESLNWQRIGIAGHSQGAALAAYIGKEREVFRVVLLSSPWDHFPERQNLLAPWLQGESKTPHEKWFGAFHIKEQNAAMLEQSFESLKIPAENIRRFTREPIPSNLLSKQEKADPYHTSVINSHSSPRTEAGTFYYADDWAFLLGRAKKA